MPSHFSSDLPLQSPAPHFYQSSPEKVPLLPSPGQHSGTNPGGIPFQEQPFVDTGAEVPAYLIHFPAHNFALSSAHFSAQAILYRIFRQTYLSQPPSPNRRFPLPLPPLLWLHPAVPSSPAVQSPYPGAPETLGHFSGIRPVSASHRCFPSAIRPE